MTFFKKIISKIFSTVLTIVILVALAVIIFFIGSYFVRFVYYTVNNEIIGTIMEKVLYYGLFLIFGLLVGVGIGYSIMWVKDLWKESKKETMILKGIK